MYLKRVGRQAIRQGDIIHGMVYCKPMSHPHLVCEVSIPSPFTKRAYKHQEANKGWNALSTVNPGTGFCVVLSQCCELAIRDDGECKAQFILMSPLQEVAPGRLKAQQEMFDQIRENSLDSYSSSYWLEALPQGGFPFLAEFSHIFSIPVSASVYGWILESKVGQLTPRARVNFKQKLGNFLGRSTEEEEKAGLWD